MSPPSGTVELNRTSSVNLTCLVSGQAGVHMEWYKNRRHIPALSQIRRIRYANDSVKSVLTLNRVKYKDRGSIISCSAWYPTLAINSTRNVLLLVHGRDTCFIETLHIFDNCQFSSTLHCGECGLKNRSAFLGFGLKHCVVWARELAIQCL